MIKRTLYFGNPAYLSLKNEQLVVRLPEVEKSNVLDSFKKNAVTTIPIEDIGVMILDNQQITVTQGLLEKLLENNSAVITCDDKRMPFGLFLPICGNTTQSERFRYQIEASLPLKKQLWQQTVIAKIDNQATLLEQITNAEVGNMRRWIGDVKSGDSDNLEARAAAYYWKNIFTDIPDFTRGREGLPPNNLLNYGYAVLRAIIARSLVSSGLLPTLGIFHRNKYNAYCLADDIMEPYRPFIDKLVIDIIGTTSDYSDLTQDIKIKLLSIPVLDVVINNKRSPLMVAAGLTTSSLQKCYAGESRRLVYPEMSK